MQVKKKIQVKHPNSEKSLGWYSFKSYNVYTLDANMYF